MAQKPLTGKQGAFFLCVLVVVVLVFRLSLADLTAAVATLHQIGVAVFAAMALYLLGSIVRTALRSDLQPDILAKLYPVSSVLQFGSAHFYASATQSRGTARIWVVIQNLREGDTRFHLTVQSFLRTFLGHRQNVFATDVPDLDRAVPGAGVTLAWIDAPLSPIDGPAEFRLALAGSATGSGRRIRFRRRNPVTKKVGPVQTLLLMCIGHFRTGGGTFLHLRCAPWDIDSAATAPRPGPCRWQSIPLWTPQEPCSADEVAAKIATAR